MTMPLRVARLLKLSPAPFLHFVCGREVPPGVVRSARAGSVAGLALCMLLQPSLAAAQPRPVDPGTIDLAYAQSLVNPGQQLRVVLDSVQAAVDAASPGDVIFVPPGTYRENVQVRTAGLTIVGSRGAILDGTGLAGSLGIDVRPPETSSALSDFTLVGLSIQNYERTGVILRDVVNYSLLSTEYKNNAEYGLFPIRSTNGLIEGNTVSGSDDSGIYIGRSSGATIRDNAAFDNTIGIEIENSVGVSVIDNNVERNTVGVFGVVLPGLTPPATENLIVSGNMIFNNDRLNPVTDETDIISLLPYGVGLLFVATDLTRVTNNFITDNDSIGLGVISLPPFLASEDPRVDPRPDFNFFIDNSVLGNGTNPDPKLAILGFPPADIVWDGTGRGNGWLNNAFGTSVPAQLPAVPEPTTWLMMLAGFAAIGFAMRRTQTERVPDPVLA